jgi:hypothetical protein
MSKEKRAGFVEQVFGVATLGGLAYGGYRLSRSSLFGFSKNWKAAEVLTGPGTTAGIFDLLKSDSQSQLMATSTESFIRSQTMRETPDILSDVSW